MADDNDQDWNRIKTNNSQQFKTTFVSDDVAKTLVCCACKNLLSVRPVSIDIATKPNRHFCGRCKPIVVAPLHIDYSYYALSESFLFPCKNAKYGCRTKLRHDKVKAHESLCWFTRVNCPMQLCDVRSRLGETTHHLLYTHRDSMKNGKKFHVSQNKSCTESKVLHFARKYYVVELNSTREWFTVSIAYLHQPLEDFQYTLTVKPAARNNKNEIQRIGKNSETIKFTYQEVIQELISHNFYFVMRIEDAKKLQAVKTSYQKLEFVQE